LLIISIKGQKTETTKTMVTTESKIGNNIDKKLENLKEILLNMESVLIAYSGGVDSTLLLKVSKDTLGDKVLAVTANSLTYPSWEIEAAREMAQRLGARHMVIETQELANPEFVNNLPDRCYYCKRELFSKLALIAKEFDLNYVLDGSNYDDLNDFRPGMQAAREFKVRSPLKEAAFTKEDIRQLSKELGLPTWDKPSFACLASRFPYGTAITKENLIRIGEAERFLRSSGMRQVRVRHYNHIARIEATQEQISKLLSKELRGKIVNKFKDLGYTYVTVDLEGYRTGSMNEVLPQKTEENAGFRVQE